jgi:16S rRNA (adenine1518-N6/adenine1519-N6)-dimethyltransferase
MDNHKIGFTLHAMQHVRAKKHLGQHFLKDEHIAQRIVQAFADHCTTQHVLEIGPGTGVLTKYLLNLPSTIHAMDVDKESVDYLRIHYPQLIDTLHLQDFLSGKLEDFVPMPFSLIGNFPYNISSQIVFKLIEYRAHIPLMTGMFQKEVAERLAAPPGNKSYGILSVLTQAYFDVTYLFTVDEHVFTPPPKVKSGVVRLLRKTNQPDVPQKNLFAVVKTAFNQRRKKLRNALHSFGVNDELLQQANVADKRAEQLSLSDFVELTKLIMAHGKN